MSKGCGYRIEGHLTVDDLVRVGSWVRTSYGTGGLVLAVKRHEAQHLSCWTIIYIRPEKIRVKQIKAGTFYDFRDYNYLHELVVVNGRILKLFENNSDEVFVVTGPDDVLPVQMQLSMPWGETHLGDQKR